MPSLLRASLVWTCAVCRSPVPRIAASPAVDTSSWRPICSKLLQQIKAADTDLLAVSEEDGRFLRVMVASSRATRALEIGGANGYSAIWIGLGLRETGGTSDDDRVRSGAREDGGRQHPPRRASPTS